MLAGMILVLGGVISLACGINSTAMSVFLVKNNFFYVNLYGDECQKLEKDVSIAT